MIAKPFVMREVEDARDVLERINRERKGFKQRFDPYDLLPHEREQWLSGQRSGWQRVFGTPQQQALMDMQRPPLEEISKIEGWYDQPEWVRREMMKSAGYGISDERLGQLREQYEASRKQGG